MSFGAIGLANTAGGSGTTDVFVAKLADAGNTSSFAWAQRAGGAGGDGAAALVLSGTSIHVAGAFEGPTASFGAASLTNPDRSTTLGFLATLADPTLTATAAARPLAPATVFPNPAQRTATLRLPAGAAPASLTLTDAQGRAVRHYPAPAGAEVPLDLQNLPAGLYLLRGPVPAVRLLLE